jgi:simple sugar transport system ATP-binding protein
MNILFGIHQRDGGEIIYGGKPVKFQSPHEAIAGRIGMVHQHFTLSPSLTVSQNVTLGLKSTGHPFPSRKKIDMAIGELSSRYGLDVDPRAIVKNLSVGQQQRVEIIKLLYRDAQLLILDEPTAVLTPGETEQFFAVLKRLRSEGHAVIIITHRIAEVMEITDRVTILRDGKNAGSFATASVTPAELSRRMIGRETLEVIRPAAQDSAGPGGEGLRLDNVSLMRRNRVVFGPLSLHIPPGRILGIAGVDGNGQKELAEIITGIQRHQTGSITLDGHSLDGLSVIKRRKMGIGYISEDRRRDSLILAMDLMENILLKTNSEKRAFRNGLLDRGRLKAETAELVSRYSIKAASLETPIRFLSGGNQQKLILGREMTGNPRLIIASQPSRGLDIGASEFVHNRLVEHRNLGCMVMVLSADLEEILLLSDTVAVIHRGKIMGVMERNNVDLTALGLLMAGIAA